jgi:hypothetical protein
MTRELFRQRSPVLRSALLVRCRWWLALLALSFSPCAEATPLQFQSASQQTALLELYTSEGCSSCPPAEKWLSRWVDSPQLWRDFVPLAFHVDYWDSLGWRDPWGAEQFSHRQRDYGRWWQRRTIYTPGFAWNGREWRGWNTMKLPQTTITNAGIITVTSTDTNNWKVHFRPSSVAQTNYEAHVVWMVSGVKTQVEAGENEGRTLKHDFVVLTLTNAPLAKRDGGVGCELHLPAPNNAKSGRLALAVWVTEAGKLEPLQATGGWVTRR